MAFLILSSCRPMFPAAQIRKDRFIGPQAQFLSLSPRRSDQASSIGSRSGQTSRRRSRFRLFLGNGSR